MAIRKLTFSFEVPITQLLGLIATGNSALKIDVLGDDKVHPLKALNGTKLLEGPKKARGGVNGRPRSRGKDKSGQPLTAYSAIIRALAKAADHTLTLADLHPIVTDLGLSASSANSQISVMRARGHAKRVTDGTYQLTKNGLAEAAKRNLIKADHG